MHKKVITIWGSSLPEFGTGLWQAHENSRNFEAKELKCRPCSITAKSVCPKKHFGCMYEHEGKIIGQYADEIF